jgi:hypothetical protein
MAKGKILELIAENAEHPLKQAIDMSVLNDVPIVGSIVKLLEIGSSIRDKLYTEKVRKFLEAINEVTDEKRSKFRESVISGDENIERLVQKILLVIESQSDVEKSELIANFFLAYLDGTIDHADFRRALDVTSSYFLDDLMQFLVGSSTNGIMHKKFEDLELMGLSTLVGSPLIGFDKRTIDQKRRHGGGTEDPDAVLFNQTSFGSTFQVAYYYGARLREKTEANN